MVDNVYVRPATESNRVLIKTIEVDGVQYPVYISHSIRNDELTPQGADGTFVPLQTDEDGALWVHEKHHAIDTGNSTTSELAGDAVFTGAAVDLLSYSSVSVIIKASHDSATDGMTFEYSPDNNNWDKLFLFTFTAGNGGRVFQLPIHARYFRVVYTNGSTLQTSFRVQTLLLHATPSQTTHRLIDDVDPDRSGALVKAAIIAQKAGTGDLALIQATAGGNLKFSLEEFDDSFNTKPLPTRETKVTAFGEILTGQLHPQFQGSFEYTVDNTDLNTNTEVNGGTVTQASGMAVMTTSTTTASTACFRSKQHARYKSGLGGANRFTALFTTPVAATEQLIGLADEAGSSESFKNGYMIGYVGTVFGYHRFQNDVLTTVPIAGWDDPLDGSGTSGMTIAQTNLGVFYIVFQYLGAGPAFIYAENAATGLPALVHTDLYSNLNTTPSTFNPNFHHTMWVDNKATTSNLILKSSSYAYFVEGMTSLIELHQPQNSTGIRSKASITTETAIFTIRNKATYASKTNFIDILMEHLSASIEADAANNLGSIRLIKNTTLGGTPSYNDINATNSVVEIDVAGTTVTGGATIFPAPLAGKNDKFIESIRNLKLILNPGETLTLAGTSVASATMQGSSLWRELF